MHAFHTLHLSQPHRLVVVLWWYGESVEEHQDDDQPIERHRFDSQSALPAAEPVPAAPAPTAGDEIMVSTVWLTLKSLRSVSINNMNAEEGGGGDQPQGDCIDVFFLQVILLQ